MPARLTDKLVKDLPPPAVGNRITYDETVRGLGVRVTSAGARAFIFNYRAGGIERRITIGDATAWTVKAARDKAKELRLRVDGGADPRPSVRLSAPPPPSLTSPTASRRNI